MANKKRKIRALPRFQFAVCIGVGVLLIFILAACCLAAFANNPSSRIDSLMNTLQDCIKVSAGLVFGLLGGKAL